MAAPEHRRARSRSPRRQQQQQRATTSPSFFALPAPVVTRKAEAKDRLEKAKAGSGQRISLFYDGSSSRPYPPASSFSLQGSVLDYHKNSCKKSEGNCTIARDAGAANGAMIASVWRTGTDSTTASTFQDDSTSSPSLSIMPSTFPPIVKPDPARRFLLVAPDVASVPVAVINRRQHNF